MRNLLFVLCILLIGCKKNNNSIIDTGNSGSPHPSAIYSYGTGYSGAIDSTPIILHYDITGNKIHAIDLNTYPFYPSSSLTFEQSVPNVINMYTDYSLPYTHHYFNYYGDAGDRIFMVIDSILSRRYTISYNSKNYITNVVESAYSDDTLWYSYFDYDASDNLVQIRIYSQNSYDSSWMNTRTVLIEPSNIRAPVRTASSFTLGWPQVYSNYKEMFGPLFFAFQSLDMPFDFGNRQQFLPAKFMVESNTYSIHTIDSFSYTFNSSQLMTKCIDYKRYNLNSNLLTGMLKDTIIY